MFVRARVFKVSEKRYLVVALIVLIRLAVGEPP